MHLRHLLLLVSLGLTAPTLVFAQAQSNVPTRVAVVDVQKVITESNAGKAAFEKLKGVQESRMAQAKQMDEEVRKLDTDLNNRRASLSETKQAELQQQIADKRIRLQRFAQDAEQEIGQLRDRELQALELKIKPVIDALAKDLGLAAIFNKFESGLIYADDRIDITDQVIARFNAAK